MPQIRRHLIVLFSPAIVWHQPTRSLQQCSIWICKLGRRRVQASEELLIAWKCPGHSLASQDGQIGGLQPCCSCEGVQQHIHMMHDDQS